MANFYLPDEEALSVMIDNAWKEFCQEGKKAGYNINDDTADGFVKDAFVGGYCYGFNDILSIIRGQAQAYEVVNSVYENGKGK